MADPHYWADETSGVLRPAVEAYLNGWPMTPQHIAALRAYLRQWIAGAWCGDAVPDLRSRIDSLTSRDAISRWLDDALDPGIDPL